MASEYQYPGRGQGGGVEGQRRISTRTLTSANMEPIAEELLFGPPIQAPVGHIISTGPRGGRSFTRPGGLL